MLTDYNMDLRQKNSPEIKPIKKLGTLQIGVVESTPVVWNGELYRFEWVRNHGWGRAEGVTREVGCYHFVNMQNLW